MKKIYLGIIFILSTLFLSSCTFLAKKPIHKVDVSQFSEETKKYMKEHGPITVMVNEREKEVENKIVVTESTSDNGYLPVLKGNIKNKSDRILSEVKIIFTAYLKNGNEVVDEISTGSIDPNQEYPLEVLVIKNKPKGRNLTKEAVEFYQLNIR